MAFKTTIAEDVDPITLAVFEGTLDATIREMTVTMRRAAMSPVLAVGNDFSNCIADGQARMIAQGEDQPVHLGAIIYAVKEVAKYFGDDIAPGDAIYHNDPRTGGSHLQDMTLYKPVFFEDELLFWTVNRAHMNETGGPVAGGYNPLAEEIWAEGLRISPLKIYEKGKPRQDVIDLMMTNFRISRLMRGDLGAQMAACTLAERRLLALLEKYGVDEVKRSQEIVLDRAEQLMRAEITAMPDGEYYGHTFVEDNGRGSGDMPIDCTLRIEGDEIQVSLKAPPSVNSYVNSYQYNSISAVYMAMIHVIDPNVPHNEGLYRPINIDLGEPGTIINAREPAACGLTTNTPSENIADAVREAFSHAVPVRAGGAWAHHCINSLFGTDPRHGEPYAYYAHLSGWSGGGAYWGMDGEPMIGSLTAAGAAMTGDIEVIEHAVPIHVHRYELDPDSGCPGRWRGGMGCVFEFSVNDHDTLMTQFGDGMKYAPPSVLEAGSPYNSERVFRKHILRGPDRTPEKLDLHCVRTVYAGESVLIYEPGGGGLGPPFERDPAMVAEDVRNEFVTLDRAREEYGVVVDPDTFAVDEAATGDLRDSA